MTATSHALLGTLVAVRFTDPVVSVPLALGLHYVADFVPHWDSGTNRREKSEKRFLIEAIIDGLISIVVAGLAYYYIFGLNSFYYLYLIVGISLLPDILTVMTRFVMKKKSVLWDWHNRLQSRINQRMQLPWGLLTQIITIGVVYIFLFRIFI